MSGNKDTEKVKVRRVDDSVNKSSDPQSLTTGQKLYYAFFPLIGGLVIDFADLLTPGLLGIYGGMLVGITIGWLITGIYNLKPRSRLIWSLLAGIYCTIPGTFWLPIATVIGAFGRYYQMQDK